MPTIARAEKVVATELDVVAMDLKVVAMDLKVVAPTLEIVAFAFTPCRTVARRTRSIYRKQRCRLGRRHAGLRLSRVDCRSVQSYRGRPRSCRRMSLREFWCVNPFCRRSRSDTGCARRHRRSSQLDLAMSHPDFRPAQSYPRPGRSHLWSVRWAFVLSRLSLREMGSDLGNRCSCLPTSRSGCRRHVPVVHLPGHPDLLSNLYRPAGDPRILVRCH